MSITATIGWESELSKGANRDARALTRLVEVLGQVGSLTTSTTTAPLAASLGQVGNASAIAASQVEQLKLARQREAAESKAAAVAAKANSDIQRQREGAAAANAAQQNKALAAVVQAQVRGDQQRASAAAKGAQDRLRIEAQGEQQRLSIAEKAAADIAKIHAKKDADLARQAARPASGGGGGGFAPSGGGEGAPTSGLGSVFAGLEGLGPQAALLGKVLGMWESLLNVIVGVLGKAGSLAVSAVSFKETTLIGFEALLGSTEKASALYEKALDLSDKVGLDKGRVVRELSKFVTAGFDEKGALAAVKAVADVTQVLGDAAGGKLENVLTKIQAAGKLTTRDVQALGKLGLPAAQIYDQIGKAMGKSAKEAEALAKAGQVNAKVAEDAIEAVVGKKFGGLAEKAGKTVPRILGDIVDEFSRLFDQINIDPFRDSLKSISDFLTGDLRKELKTAFTDLGSALFELIFGPFKDGNATQDVGKTFISIIQQIAGVVKGITPGVRSFIAGLKDGFKDVSPALGKVSGVFLELIAKLGGAGNIAQAAGKGFGFLVGVLALIVEVATAVVGSVMAIAGVFVAVFGALWAGVDMALGLIIDSWTAAIDYFSGIAESVLDIGNLIGTNLIDGMAGGLLDNISSALDAAGEVANAIITQVKSILGIASPSRVFGEIGMYSVAGFAGAVNDNAHHAINAAGNMAAGAAAAASDGSFGPSFGPSGAAGGRRGGGASIAAGAIVIQIGAGASSEKGGDAALARLVRDEVEKVLREFGEAA